MSLNPIIAPLDKGLLNPGPQYGCKTRPSLPGGISFNFSFANSSTVQAEILASSINSVANSLVNHVNIQYPR